MNFTYWMLIFFATVIACSCDEEANEKTAQDRKDVIRLNSNDDAINKRQTAHEATLGYNQHYQYGASPGHFVIKSAKQDDSQAQFTYEYLNSLKKLPAGNLYKAETEPRPAYQQFVVQRNPRPYIARPAHKEPKIIKIDPAENEQQLYLDEKYYLQQAYQQPRVPLVLRPSQAVKASPVQGVYTSQGYVPVNDGPALHEARVHAALSVADNKPSAYATNSQPAYKASAIHHTAFPDSTFEKELAELVSANQALELKERPQQFNYYQITPQNSAQFSASNVAPKKLPQIKINKPTPTYSSIVPLARSKTPAPQQYLIETTRPQAVQSRPIPQKVKPQYLQYYPTSDEPVYAEYQPTEQKSALKIVSAPRLQTAQPPVQYEPLPQKQVQNSVPSYVKYYQTIQPQQEEVEAPKEVKIGSFYPKYNVPKPQPLPQATADEQPQYVIQYRPQPKPEEPSANYVRYEASKPQLVEYSGENEAFLQAILAQAQARKHTQESIQKTVKIQPKQPITTTTSEEPRSSIYVSKSIAPKKAEQSVKILNPTTPEPTEEVQTVRLPPPKNKKVYTQEEFQALIAAGYSVTPVPVTDDEGTPAKFSPPPVNYPGHNSYQYVSETPDQQFYEKENAETYSAPTSAPQTQVIRKRKQRRPTSPPQYRYSQDTAQGVSETQTQLKYSLPLDTEESLNYGTRKQPKERIYRSS